MKEFVEKLTELEDMLLMQLERSVKDDVENVNQLAEEYNNKSTDTSTEQLEEQQENFYSERFNRVM